MRALVSKDGSLTRLCTVRVPQCPGSGLGGGPSIAELCSLLGVTYDTLPHAHSITHVLAYLTPLTIGGDLGAA